jgi:hypothetical protein
MSIETNAAMLSHETTNLVQRLAHELLALRQKSPLFQDQSPERDALEQMIHLARKAEASSCQTTALAGEVARQARR